MSLNVTNFEFKFKVKFLIKNSRIWKMYLVASRDIKEGELILKENVEFVGTHLNAAPLCFRCNKLLHQKVKVCQNCNVATVCSETCEGNGHNVNECTALKTSGVTSKNLVEHPLIVTPLRCLLLRNYNEDVWVKLNLLESHLDKRENTAIWKYYRENAEKVLKKIGALTENDLKNKIIQKICGTLDVNTFEVRPPAGVNGVVSSPPGSLRGLYLEAALMAHDCSSNTHLAVDDNFVLHVHASNPISEDELIFFNYSNSLQGTNDRRQHLKIGKYFDCTCNRCNDPSEMGTEMSSLVCPRCKNGLIRPNDKNLDVYKTVWECLKCKHNYKGSLIKITIDECRRRIDLLENANVNEMEKLLEKLLFTLSPQHYLILELKQNLIGLYTQTQPTKFNLNRKIKLCNDLLHVLKIIEPGISRMQAITSYELHSAEDLLANKEYTDKEISPEDYVVKLVNAETTLKFAIKSLLYEPTESPEGRLAARALTEMRMLKIKINDITTKIEGLRPESNQKTTKSGQK